MSVRIYQLSKEIGLENAELIELLRERGFEVKSASSTVDNISAESLREEFANKTSASESDSDEAASEPEAEEPAAPEPPSAPDLASFVRSPEDIAKEKEEAKKAAAAAAAPKPPAPPPPAPAAPAAPKPVGPPAPRPVAPPPMAPPSGPGRVAPPAASKPAPVSPPPAAANPGVRPAPSATPPAPPAAKVPAPVKAPAPAAPPPAAPAPKAPPAPPAPPALSGPPKPPAPAGPGAVAPPSAAKPEAATEAGDPDEIKQITLKPPIVVRDFAKEIGVKPFKLISELMEMGIFASVNQSLEEEVASTLAAKHGFLLEIRHRGEGNKAKKKQAAAPVDEEELLEHRPPVVCIMGHVDHGKTSLLDYIRKANVTKGEAGGITQHIGAYQIEHNDHKITFLDTPGHEAFNSMRARGADVTDIAILVVAADDGFKPQTDEALKFIQKSGVQPIVAINKIDTKGANVDRVKQQMQERGIASEDWGGQTICVECSAIKGTGIEELLDMVLLQAEVLELQANPKKPSTGIVIEASVEVGRGPTATIIVQAGTLKVGDALVCGAASTKVKAMLDENGKQVKVAPPSTPVRVIGWSSTPDCGDQYETVKNEKVAKSKAAENEIEIKAELAAMEDEATAGMTPQEKLFAAIAKTQKKTLRLIVKADAFGSLEAICQALNSIESEKVALEIIGKGVGVISKSDVEKAAAGDAEVIGFNVRSDNGVQAVAKNKAVKISSFQIIYELVDRVREDMIEMLDPEFRENKIGAAEVRAVFPIAKGFVAGCLVTEGRVSHGANARVLRRNKVLHDSKVLTLRRVKDDVKEVRAGTECGIQVEKFNDYKPGDTIEIYEVHEVRAAL
ncbi:translation initiation factor IF-2 [Pelagicoccus sp. SDUM812005]|uniref:translation initiation factor IF-2 n=1 Tax=Pelagicoccus sp. SDUM812005 TaxID=3041257 RepID=UPI00280EA5D8|nr:translation initiation factor IF-2 [Pelagicoccus sp. SDUM812005]MDQ8182564.1 translation initiation factor IF-2 [Pelagicoccus sp. SDUM812005]